jgi:hypothetical protein
MEILSCLEKILTGRKNRQAKKRIVSANKDCIYARELLSLKAMVKNIYLNGRMNTFLVYEDEGGTLQNPIFAILQEQAERIEMLEQQNNTLIEQEEVLLHLLDLTARTGSLMARNIKALEDIKKGIKNKPADGSVLKRKALRKKTAKKPD